MVNPGWTPDLMASTYTYGKACITLFLNVQYISSVGE